MAKFRYRVVGPKGVVAGCPNLEIAKEIVRIMSLNSGAGFVIFDHVHGKGKTEIAWFLNGLET